MIKYLFLIFLNFWFVDRVGAIPESHTSGSRSAVYSELLPSELAHRGTALSPNVAQDVRCSCDSKGAQIFEEPLRYSTGRFSGQCIDSCRFRAPRKIASLSEDYFIYNLLHRGRYWKFRASDLEVDGVYLLFERFLDPISHVALRFRLKKPLQLLELNHEVEALLNPRDERELSPTGGGKLNRFGRNGSRLKNPRGVGVLHVANKPSDRELQVGNRQGDRELHFSNNRGEFVVHKGEEAITDLVYSPEAAVPRGQLLRVLPSLFGDYVFVHRLMSVEAARDWMVVTQKHQVDQFELRIGSSEAQSLLTRVLDRSTQAGMSESYWLLKRNCSTVLADLLMEAPLGTFDVLSRILPVPKNLGLLRILNNRNMVLGDRERGPLSLNEEFLNSTAVSKRLDVL